MEQQVKQLAVPSLTPAQVEELLNYANELPTKYGLFIINKIQDAALKLEKAESENVD
jgi:hypothetical protein